MNNEQITETIEAITDLSDHTRLVANAIAPVSSMSEIVMPGNDATGGTVLSLTEAVMGVTAGLMAIAEAINAHDSGMSDVVEAIRELAASQE